MSDAEPFDDYEFTEGGTYDGVPLLDLAGLTAFERKQRSAYQEDGDLAVLARMEEDSDG